MPGEHGNIFLLAVSSAKDGKNLVRLPSPAAMPQSPSPTAFASAHEPHSTPPHPTCAAQVCKRHNTASGRLVSADIDEVLSSVERMRRENPTEDELQLEGRGVPSGLKVYVGCDSSFTYSVVVGAPAPPPRCPLAGLA